MLDNTNQIYLYNFFSHYCILSRPGYFFPGGISWKHFRIFLLTMPSWNRPYPIYLSVWFSLKLRLYQLINQKLINFSNVWEISFNCFPPDLSCFEMCLMHVTFVSVNCSVFAEIICNTCSPTSRNASNGLNSLRKKQFVDASRKILTKSRHVFITTIHEHNLRYFSERSVSFVMYDKERPYIRSNCTWEIFPVWLLDG